MRWVHAILCAVRGAAGLVFATGTKPRSASGRGSARAGAADSAPGGTPAMAVAADVSQLPLVELPVQRQDQGRFALILSGDGGWAAIDRAIARALNQEGIPVVGFNCLKYFWTKRTPADTARDIQAVLESYAATWAKGAVVLIGYSRGADVLPFIVNQLPEGSRARICLTVLLGAAQTVEFEFHMSDWFSASSGKGLPVLPEVIRMKGLPLLCVYGDEETDSLCKVLPAGLAHVERVPGAHHFEGNHAWIGSLILRELESVPRPRRQSDMEG